MSQHSSDGSELHSGNKQVEVVQLADRPDQQHDVVISASSGPFTESSHRIMFCSGSH